MERTQKEAVIKTVKDKFDRMTSAVFLDFKGMNVEAVTKLRDQFRKSGVEYRVVKNTLVHHAIKEHAWAKNLDAATIPAVKRHRVELRGPERGRQGREGVPKGQRQAEGEGGAHRGAGPLARRRGDAARDDAGEE